MIRKELKLGPTQVSKDELLALWKALDADGSGLITSGEFGQFMKLGAPEKGPGWKALRTQRNREAAKKVVEKLDAEQGRNVSQKLAGVEPADHERVVEMSKKLNEALQFVPDPAARSWVKLFNKIDEDGSGKMAYREFMRMVRTELKQGSSELGKEELTALWKALDADGSGLVTIGEFGQFMKLGLPEKGIGWKAARTQRNREAAKKVIEKLDAEQGRNVSQKLAGVEPASEYQVVALSAKLNEALQFVPDPAAPVGETVQQDRRGRLRKDGVPRVYAIADGAQAGSSEQQEELTALWKALDADGSGWDHRRVWPVHEAGCAGKGPRLA